MKFHQPFFDDSFAEEGRSKEEIPEMETFEEDTLKEDQMQLHVNKCIIELVLGDITDQVVDVIVNAANEKLMGGAGVDGAIHSRGGSAIMQETGLKYPDGCPTGSAVISTAGNLDAKFVIHTVGPIWYGGMSDEATLLKGAYQSSLQIAKEHQCESLAFPSISTGAYGFPIDLASRIALETAIEFAQAHDFPKLVRFVLFDQGTYGAFASTLENFLDQPLQ